MGTLATPDKPTFTKIGDRLWGVRWPLALGEAPAAGTSVTVEKRDGSTNDVVVAAVVKEYDDAVVMALQPKKAPKLNADEKLCPTCGGAGKVMEVS